MHRYWALFLSLFLGVLLAACEEPENVNDGLIDNPNVQREDTFSLSLQTEVLEAAEIQNAPFFFMFGSWRDPHMGHIDARTYTEMGLFSERTSLAESGDPASLTYDSLVFKLDIFNIVGNPASPMRIKIYELAEAMKASTEYTIADSVPVKPAPIGETVVQNLDPAGKNDISIQLDDELGQRLMELDSTDLASDDNFKEVFKGISIEAEPLNPDEENAIYRAQMVAQDSVKFSFMQLHYTESTDSGDFARSYTFAPEAGSGNNSISEGFNAFERTGLQGTPLQQAIDQPGAAEHLFMQAGAPVVLSGRLSSESLRSIGRGGINQAELRLYMDFEEQDTTTDQYSPISTTAIYENAANGEGPLFDRGVLAQNGLSTNSLDNGGYFTMDITPYVQEIASGNIENNGFWLYPVQRNLLNWYLRRGVLHGPASPDTARRPELILYFTSPAN
jgi:hypothetical protein